MTASYVVNDAVSFGRNLHRDHAECCGQPPSAAWSLVAERARPAPERPRSGRATGDTGPAGPAGAARATGPSFPSDRSVLKVRRSSRTDRCAGATGRPARRLTFQGPGCDYVLRRQRRVTSAGNLHRSRRILRPAAGAAWSLLAERARRAPGSDRSAGLKVEGATGGQVASSSDGRPEVEECDRRHGRDPGSTGPVGPEGRRVRPAKPAPPRATGAGGRWVRSDRSVLKVEGIAPVSPAPQERPGATGPAGSIGPVEFPRSRLHRQTGRQERRAGPAGRRSKVLRGRDRRDGRDGYRPGRSRGRRVRLAKRRDRRDGCYRTGRS